MRNKIFNFTLKTIHRMAVLIVCAIFVPLWVEGAVEVGGVLSPFELGGSARALGMGGAAVAVTGDGDSFFENPATLATLSYRQVLTFHAPLFLDTLYDSVGYVHPIGAHNSFGVAFARLATTGIFQTVNNIQPVSSFTSEQFQGLAGYGFQVIEDLDFGATVKYVHEQLGTYQGSGVGVDAGILYHFTRNWQDFSQIGYKNLVLGFSVSNLLQPQTKLFQMGDQPARVYRPALSYLFEPSATSTLWLAAEAEVQETGDVRVKAGLEYGLDKAVFGRVGFDGTGPTAGAGLRIAGIEVDYAYNQKDLGTLHRFSLTYRFDRYTDPLQAQKIDLLKWVAKSYTKTNDYGPAIKAWQNVQKEYPDDEEAAHSIQDLQRKRKNAVADQIQMAKDAMSRGGVDRALPLIAKILSLDPGNPEAKELLKHVDKSTTLSSNYVRGVEAYSKEDYASAVQYLQMVQETDPNYRDVKFLYHDAQSHYLPLESMSKEWTELYAKGVDAYMIGDYPKAIDIWQQVLEKNPKNFLIQRNIDEARSRLREKSAAPAAKPDSKGKP